MTELSSDAKKAGRLKLRGKVDGYSPVSITGRLRPFSPRSSSQFALEFKNVEMTSFSPYSGKFIGYRLKKGKLSVALGYKIRGAKVEGDNKVIIDLLELGDEVDSPDAISVPVKLAIALLEDRDGRIELDLPVSGDLDDPESASVASSGAPSSMCSRRSFCRRSTWWRRCSAEGNSSTRSGSMQDWRASKASSVPKPPTLPRR